MLLSLTWLKDFVNIPKNLTPKKLGELLTVHMAEVESVENLGKNLENIVVGKVLEVKKHPNADKLVLVKVDLGGRKIEVVCGGTNLRKGMLVAMALPGAKIRWHGKGDLVKLERAEVRGVESEGMICAADEIGLTDPSCPPLSRGGKIGEIMDISTTKVKVGMPLREALGMDDVILEIENKSITNRPDLWGHYGVAREISALLKTKLKPWLLLKNIKINNEVDLKINTQNYKQCPRFMGVVVDNVKIGPSPEWLQARLRAVGLRPINNIVDVTNYVLYEIGQPMHAYDSSQLTAHSSQLMIIVRQAKDGERLTTLDGQNFTLEPSMLVVADAEKPISLAGIMGGQNMGIKDDTTSIILEAANFNPISVRQTSMRLGLRTDSSARFEKGLDPNLPEAAINRALQLIFELCPGARVASKIIDEKKFKLNQGPIIVDTDFINERIGVALSKQEIVSILNRLGFKVSGSGKKLSVQVPTWRATGDISIPEDIVEEVARIYGYGNIPVLTPKVDLRPAPVNLEKKIEEKIKDILAFDFGMSEVYSYPFADEKQLKEMGVEYSDYLQVGNPMSSDQTLIKQSLIPALIVKVKNNLRFFDTFKLFEISKVFYKDEKHFSREEKMIAGVLTGEDGSFYMAKGVMENLGKKLGIEFEYKKLDKYLSGRGTFVEVRAGKDKVGVLGEMEIGEKLPAGFFELKLQPLVDYYNSDKEFKPLPKFPEIQLDLSLIVDDNVEWGDIYQTIIETGGQLVRDVKLFDVYIGKEIEPGKKSLAFRIIYRADDRTLEFQEAEAIQEKIIQLLTEKFGAELRA